jgi:guanine nucleotide-binding protein subunit gamma, fungi
MPAGYTTRDVGDPSQMKKNKQSMADLKLRRLTELNNRLREDLERERIPVSQAAKRLVATLSLLKALEISLTDICSIIAYTNSTKDFMVPSVWGTVDKKDDPYAPQQNGGCCIIM